MKTFKTFVFSLVIIATFNSCGKSLTCDYDPCLYKATASEVYNLQTYLQTNGIVATQICSGMYYRIDSQGSGPSPDACNAVDVTYEGRLTNGNVFDKSNGPVTFNLTSVIRGWTNGLPYLKSGGTITLFIPPSLGYGASGYGSIPPNAILIFTINLMGVH